MVKSKLNVDLKALTTMLENQEKDPITSAGNEVAWFEFIFFIGGFQCHAI